MYGGLGGLGLRFVRVSGIDVSVNDACFLLLWMSINGPKIDPVTGLLEGVRFTPSPNCDERPAGVAVDVLVIHAISLPPNRFGGPEIERFFCNRLDITAHPFFAEIRDLRASAHFFIRRDGEIVQLVPLHRRAWHAGESYCEGRTCVNDFSVGVELEGSNDVCFEDAQYIVLAELTRAVTAAYPLITLDKIYGHSDVTPGRKTDPGPYFDWGRYRRLCEG